MRTIRFPISGLMGAVLVVALGLAAMRNASETWAGIIFLLTCAVLGLAIVGTICRGDGERAWWLGFAIFGWGYMVLASWSSVTLPTMALLDAIGPRLGVNVQFGGGMGGGMTGAASSDRSLPQIAHCLWALAAALAGGLLSLALFGRSRVRVEKLDTRAPTAPRSHRRWWLYPVVLGSLACVIIVVFGVITSRLSPGLWAGTTFLATCGLLGITFLGAASGQGKSRQTWLGAALFGAGYMILAFGTSADRDTWPSLPTDHIIDAVRGWFPHVFRGLRATAGGVASANARIWDALEQPVPMPFGDDTPLEDVLKHIQTATTGPDGKGLPIYVDPIGLQEAEKSMTSTVRNINFEEVPLKISLRLCLKQLDMSYCIRDGLVLITSEESAITPIYHDPFAIVGHCLLALIAAGFGGIVAPLFSEIVLVRSQGAW
jgi:hypothetical protein